MQNNKLTDEGAEQIIKALETNTNLKQLVLDVGYFCNRKQNDY